MRRLSVMVKWPPAINVTRVSVRHKKLCYVVTANKVVRYPKGRSRIVYIGTTERGIERLANSAAYRAPNILGSAGIVHFDVHVVTCGTRQHVKTWRKLERALLLSFRSAHGAPPLSNVHGVKMRETNEFHYFSRGRIRHVLEDLG